MIQACYDWVWKLSGYLIFVTAVLQVVPGEKDRKYIHFFTGLVLIVMIAAPVMKFFTSDDLFAQFQRQYDDMEAQVSDMLESSAELNSAKEVWDTDSVQDSSISADAGTDETGTVADDFTGTDQSISAEKSANEGAEGGETSGIQVEEIRIGHDGENP